MSKNITIKMPLNIARYLYTIIERQLNGGAERHALRMTAKQREGLAEVYDELAFQITTDADFDLDGW